MFSLPHAVLLQVFFPEVKTPDFVDYAAVNLWTKLATDTPNT